ncbi:winged helix DNA-binding domain-containing protein [Cellulomonas sp. DKR-3]|uniref:Winged helix DNA-binding domain-containing protein n=1 Tax=Cellulomonas fulva TaxID=2835530 RepID=A0ABS5U009_9CELL|nr:crosslink repair DNA glycosylase YcaQ family protein [Cellulomonas fulva]MBT0994646.1 winged helix DNA-binding domain-containing protein [Cellulomonas fulva]
MGCVTTPQLTIPQARRTALAAQGLHRARPERGSVGIRQVQQVIDRIGLLQIDSVNVLARAHLLPLYSRLGPYDPALLDRAAGRPPRRLMEAWAHVASYVPPTTYRLLEWRRRADRDRLGGRLVDGVPLRSSAVLGEVRALIAERGPVTSAQVHALLEDRFPRTGTEWGWNWTVAKSALEYLFIVGDAAVAGRTSAFERRYDLAERVLPADVQALPEPSDADAVRGLVEISARAHGIGTERCLADYFRLGQAATRQAVGELVEEGVLERVRVVGWDRPVVRHAQAALPRTAGGVALLSPFDPLVFERRRLEELFGLRYRIEIYVPAAQRRWGYYVHPFLLGDEIAALVDLKADRASRRLLVQAAHRAPAADTADGGRPGGRRSDDEVAQALARELRLVAEWLALDDVVAGPDALGGDLMAPVLRALASGQSG